jgi:hypothetical protein
LYLVLCVLGIVLPYSQFLPWVYEHGMNLPLFLRQLFANYVGRFFGLDVLVSAVTLIGFIREEGAHLKLRGVWFPIVSVLLVGVSLGLPLFLYMRESELQKPVSSPLKAEA